MWLLSLLHYRTKHEVDEWVLFDIKQTDTGTGRIAIQYCGGCVVIRGPGNGKVMLSSATREGAKRALYSTENERSCPPNARYETRRQHMDGILLAILVLSLWSEVKES